MATNSFTVGTGGTYANLTAWESARRGLAASGDVEEAVLLDSTETSNFTLFAGNWANSPVTVRIRGNTPHNGDPAAGTQKNGGYWQFFQNNASKEINIEIEDVVLDGTGLSNYSYRMLVRSDQAASNPGTLLCRNVIIKNVTAWPGYGITLESTNASNAVAWPVTLENVVIWNCIDGASSDGYPIIWSSNGTGDRTLTLRGCTIYDGALRMVRNGSHALSVSATGCLFKPDGTNAEITFSGSSGTFSATSERCITSRTQVQHEAIFGTTTGNTYSVSFVDTAPSAGQVAFTSITGGDFSLQDHANNLAIDYVTSGTMPSTDIAGVTRDASPDAGAFEVPAPVGPTAPSDFVAGGTSHNSIAFSWTDNASDEDNYEVDYQEDGAGSWTTWDHALAANSTSDTITGLTASTTYNVRIRAVNGSGSSSYLTGQMTTDAAPAVTTRSGGGSLRLGLGLGLSGRRGGGSAATSELLWSAASTWDSGVPGIGDNVTIAAGRTVYLDTDTAALGTLTIEGTLVAKPGYDTSITAEAIIVEDGGTLRAGSEAAAFTDNLTITLTGTTPTSGQYSIDAEDGSKLTSLQRKALVCMPGGTVELHGVAPSIVRTRIGDHIDVSVEDQIIELSEPVTWAAGDKIVLSITDFYGSATSEMLTVASDVTNSTTVPVVENIAADRWGKLQYPTDSGMSLTPGTFTAPHAGTPTVLDERATVIHMTRNIVIQGADDASWSTDKFGGHTMVMGLASTWRVEGVEFRRMGQQTFKGRYPIHWHMLSFVPYVASPTDPNSGNYLGDCTAGAHYAKKCSVWNSSQRALVIHGTCGVTVEDVNAFDIQSHAFFEEDGAEERNTITRCAVMKVRDPGSGKRIKAHDSQASGFWLTNPNNVVTHCYASDCQGRGLWNSFADQAFGLCRDVAVVPRSIVIDTFDDNVGHSCSGTGAATAFPVSDEAGNLTETYYLGLNAAEEDQEFTYNRIQVWKNRDNGYTNRVMEGHYVNWTVADNDGNDFVGASQIGAKNTGPLCIAYSLNSARLGVSPLTTVAHNRTYRHAFASYHFEMDFEYVTAINYVLADETVQILAGGYMMHSGGTLHTGDLYVAGGFWEMGRSMGWHLINSHAGRLPESPYFDGFSLFTQGNPLAVPPTDKYRYWSLAGAIHDPYGYWGTAGHWIVPNRTLYTYGLSATTAVDTDWVSTPDMCYSLDRPTLDGANVEVTWNRLDNTNAIIDSHVLGDPNKSQFFPNMRSFVANRGGRFLLEYPANAPGTYSSFLCSVKMAPTTEEWFLLGIPWSGTPTTIAVRDFNDSTNLRVISTSVGSIASVIADTTGQSYYLDAGNSILWIRYQGTAAGTLDPAGPFTWPLNASSADHTRVIRVTA